MIYNRLMNSNANSTKLFVLNDCNYKSSNTLHANDINRYKWFYLKSNYMPMNANGGNNQEDIYKHCRFLVKYRIVPSRRIAKKITKL